MLSKGFKHIRTKGGHEIWSGKDALRSIVIQTHEDPIPEFIVRNNLRSMNLSTQDLVEFLNKK